MEKTPVLLCVFFFTFYAAWRNTAVVCFTLLKCNICGWVHKKTGFETSLMSGSGNPTLWQSLHSSQSFPCQLPSTVLILIRPSTCISNYLCLQWPSLEGAVLCFFTAKLRDSACSLWAMGSLEIRRVTWEAVMDQVICSVNQILALQASENPLENQDVYLPVKV